MLPALCLRLTANALRLGGRRGIQGGLDESGGCCPTRSVGRDCAPACVKPSVCDVKKHQVEILLLLYKRKDYIDKDNATQKTQIH